MTNSALRIVAPDTEIRKVTPRRPKNAAVRPREYLTVAEVEALIEGCKENRRPHRDATMILIAYRHGLRASELRDLQWTQIDFEHPGGHPRQARSRSNCKELTQGTQFRVAPKTDMVGLRENACHLTRPDRYFG